MVSNKKQKTNLPSTLLYIATCGIKEACCIALLTNISQTIGTCQIAKTLMRNMFS